MRSRVLIVGIVGVTLTTAPAAYAQTCPNDPVSVTPNSVTDIKGEDLPSGSSIPSQAWDIRRGCYNSPNSAAGPVVKISKTEKYTSIPTSNDAGNNFYNAALDVEVRSVNGSLRQPNAIHAYAYGAPLNTDVVGGFFYGLSTQSNDTNYGSFGIYAEAQTNNNYSRATGAEIRSSNYGTRDRLVSLSGQSEAMGLWVTTAGNKNTAVGVGVGRVPTTNARWQYAFLATTDSTTSAGFVSAGTEVNNQFYSGFYLVGKHKIGLNLLDATYFNSAIALPRTIDATGGINFGQDFNVFRDSLGGLRMPAKVGFGVPSVAPPTLPAALPADGTATNAQLAAGYNAIRAALIANGLAK